MTALARGRGAGRAAAPIRHVHLGLGAFFRSHQAWYTDRAPDAEGWGIAAFTGRRPELATRLAAQDGLYVLAARGAAQDEYAVISSLSRAHPAGDTAAWQRYFAAPATTIVSLTVTEQAYARDANGGLDRAREDVRSDIAALRGDRYDALQTVPGRLVGGLAARRRADGGPLTLLSCDNLPDNGGVLMRVVSELAAAADDGLAGWIGQSVASVSSLVDRITPATTPEDVDAVCRATGYLDPCAVVAEPYSEWVLTDTFAAARPAWQDTGAILTGDLLPYEQRKLWLLNGGHSLLAYAGPARGHRTVADAVGDPVVRAWLDEWWDEAARHLLLGERAAAQYRAALLGRFENPRIRHQLAQIAALGSQKLPVRVLPVLRLERAAGRLPGGAIRVVGGWVAHLRGNGVAVDDPGAQPLLTAAATVPLPEFVPAVLTILAPDLADDHELRAAIEAAATEFEQLAGSG